MALIPTANQTAFVPAMSAAAPSTARLPVTNNTHASSLVHMSPRSAADTAELLRQTTIASGAVPLLVIAVVWLMFTVAMVVWSLPGTGTREEEGSIAAIRAYTKRVNAAHDQDSDEEDTAVAEEGEEEEGVRSSVTTKLLPKKGKLTTRTSGEVPKGGPRSTPTGCCCGGGGGGCCGGGGGGAIDRRLVSQWLLIVFLAINFERQLMISSLEAATAFILELEWRLPAAQSGGMLAIAMAVAGAALCAVTIATQAWLMSKRLNLSVALAAVSMCSVSMCIPGEWVVSVGVWCVWLCVSRP